MRYFVSDYFCVIIKPAPAYVFFEICVYRVQCASVASAVKGELTGVGCYFKIISSEVVTHIAPVCCAYKYFRVGSGAFIIHKLLLEACCFVEVRNKFVCRKKHCLGRIFCDYHTVFIYRFAGYSCRNCFVCHSDLYTSALRVEILLQKASFL